MFWEVLNKSCACCLCWSRSLSVASSRRRLVSRLASCRGVSVRRGLFRRVTNMHDYEIRHHKSICRCRFHRCLTHPTFLSSSPNTSKFGIHQFNSPHCILVLITNFNLSGSHDWLHAEVGSGLQTAISAPFPSVPYSGFWTRTNDKVLLCFSK